MDRHDDIEAGVAAVRPPTGAAAAAAPFSSRLLAGLREHAIFALDARGCITSWSAPAEALTGYTAAEVVGRPYDLFGTADSPLEQLLEQATTDGTHRDERWWRRRDGGLVWVDETLHPLDDDGFVVVARDATARAANEEQLLASGAREAAGLDREQSLRSELQAADRRASFLAEASSILVATSLDFDSTVRALSRLAVSRLAEWCVIHTLDADGSLTCSEVAHRDPAIEKRLDALVDTAPHESWAHALRSVLDTGQAQQLDGIVSDDWFGEYWRGDDAAERKQLIDRLTGGAVMITPLLGRGHILGAITFVAEANRGIDDSDLLLAEELGRRAAIALDNARLFREAQEANRAKADFLAVISHELRTPLNAIMGYSDLLDAEVSGELSDRQRRQIDRIRASARHLLQLIEEILSFARIQSGGEEVVPQQVDLRQLVLDAGAVMEPMARSKGLDFRVEVGDGPLVAETDAGKVRQVLANLLSNAVKFTERGGVTLRLHGSDRDVTIEVQDTGVGIPAEHVHRAFDPFWQAERPNTRRVGGTGLGLSVSRRYARLLRGSLALQSEPGRGSTFSFTLPRRFTGQGHAPGHDMRHDSRHEDIPGNRRVQRSTT